MGLGHRKFPVCGKQVSPRPGNFFYQEGTQVIPASREPCHVGDVGSDDYAYAVVAYFIRRGPF